MFPQGGPLFLILRVKIEPNTVLEIDPPILQIYLLLTRHLWDKSIQSHSTLILNVIDRYVYMNHHDTNIIHEKQWTRSDC